MDNVKKFFEIILQKDSPPLIASYVKKESVIWKVKNSQERITEGFRMLDQSKEFLDKIKKNKALIDQNGSFET